MKKVELKVMEQIKYKIIKNLVDNNGNKKRAAVKFGIAVRQVNRLIQVYKTKGKVGFVHSNRNRLPKRTISQDIKDKIIELYKNKYFGECLEMDACEDYWLGIEFAQIWRSCEVFNR